MGNLHFIIYHLSFIQKQNHIFQGVFACKRPAAISKYMGNLNFIHVSFVQE